MRLYKDIDNDSGVSAFEPGDDYIIVEFKDGNAYRYTYRSAGSHHVEQMKILASDGDGLQAYININVKDLYESRLR